MRDIARRDLLDGEWLSWSPDSIAPSRWIRNIPLLAWMFEYLEPQLAVEIGSGSGESFRPLCQIAQRFSPRGRIVGIDPWRPDPSTPWKDDSVYEGLLDYCATRHPAGASLLRMELPEAAGEFDDESIDFLHIAPSDETAAGSPLDPSVWTAKVRAGGVIVVSSAGGEQLGDQPGKLWQHISESYPSVRIGSPLLVGLAQVTSAGEAPLIDVLQTDLRAAATLFRALGERIEHRHVLSSEPLVPAAIRAYVADLVDATAEQVRHAEARSAAGRHAVEEQLASTHERLLTTACELAQLRNEADYLMAKLADDSVRHERQTAELTREHDAHIQALKEQMALQDQACAALHQHIASQEAHLDAIRSTVSWRLTRPLRLVQAVLLKLRRR